MLKRGLIVSCQAGVGEPLHGLNIMRYMAKAAVAGGACGIRALYYDVDPIKSEVDVPVIGLVKQDYDDSEIYITPTKTEIDLVLATKADCVAIDATLRIRPNGETLEELVAYARKKAPSVELMADIATVEEAINAERLGFDYISTTLRGYTAESKNAVLPDVNFVAEVLKAVKNTKVVAEGGIYEVGQLEQIGALNPYAVVIGSAITRPALVTERFNKVLKLK
ncbi:MAG: N-acetylmannosamine-6-phosphate 2-epimerase [Clostridia bacterium]|nr:N-acetylmannosamine-6-phosphate 2-epimerase [Clostridia bacterium]